MTSQRLIQNFRKLRGRLMPPPGSPQSPATWVWELNCVSSTPRSLVTTA